MKIYYEVLPEWLGRVMYRINRELKKVAPPWIEFVKSPEDADTQIIDVIGTGSLDYIDLKDNYIMLQHCFLTAETQDKFFWLDKFQKAKLVASYLDLENHIESTEFNFLRMPWGVDQNVFYPIPGIGKEFTVMSTGHVAETECIQEAYDAVTFHNGKMVHIGKDFRFGSNFFRYEGIPDNTMNALYNRSKYVIGMRRGEGFELPIIEGISAGARGICLDTPGYRYWYGDLVEYIEDGSYSHVMGQLIELFGKPYRNVTELDIRFVGEKFSWENIGSTFWKRVEEVL